jgi:hypothetical protein
MKILNKYIGAIVLVVTCCIALLIYDEYGIGWDELQQHRMGEINYNNPYFDSRTEIMELHLNFL